MSARISASGRGTAVAIWSLGFCLLLVSVLASVVVGPADVSSAEAVAAILRRLGYPLPEVRPVTDAIVWELRLPRALTAAAVGGGLAMCGAVMQATTRNPLAEPYLLGLSAGAGLGAVLVLLAGLDLFVSLAAFCGALTALSATLTLARTMGDLTPTRTILAGIAVSAFAVALTSFVIFWSAQGDSYREVLSWLLGSLGNAGWSDAGVAGAAMLLAGVPLAHQAHRLDAFAFGDASASALGIDVRRTRWLMFVLVALLTGALVSVSGSIGFVGLVVPHAGRLLFGSGHRRLLPFVMLLGAIVLVWADLLARTAFDPRELPVGVITAILGAPAFAVVLVMARRRL